MGTFTQYSRAIDSATRMTDLPAGDRKRMHAALFPQLLTEVRELRADGGAMEVEAPPYLKATSRSRGR